MEAEVNPSICYQRLIERIERFVRSPRVKTQMKYIIKKVFKRLCKFCKGLGHRCTKCTTKKRLRKHFLKLNLSEEWKQFIESYQDDLDSSSN